MTETASPRLPGLQPWYWTAPRVAIFLFVAVLGALLWLLHRQEIEEQRTTLISDILWVEQNLRFQLTRGEEQLDQIGQDYFGGNLGDGRFQSRVKSLLLNHPGVMQLLMLDGNGVALRAAPGRKRG